MTSAGEKVAPHFHMSPEQHAWWKYKGASAPGPPSDVYQFGLIMYQLVSGFNPNTVGRERNSAVENEDRRDAISKVFMGRGSLVNDVAGLVREMLAENPDDRPTAHEVQERLLNLFRSYASHYAAMYGVQPGREY